MLTGDRIMALPNLPDLSIGMCDVVAIAELLDCSSRHVRRLADAGSMPRPIRIGRLIRWRKSDVDQWIADGCPSCRQTQRGGVR